MTVELNPSETSRALAYQLWMQAPIKTLGVTNLIRGSGQMWHCAQAKCSARNQSRRMS